MGCVSACSQIIRTLRNEISPAQVCMLEWHIHSWFYQTIGDDAFTGDRAKALGQ